MGGVKFEHRQGGQAGRQAGWGPLLLLLPLNGQSFVVRKGRRGEYIRAGPGTAGISPPAPREAASTRNNCIAIPERLLQVSYY